jgi:hypothetical protein
MRGRKLLTGRMRKHSKRMELLTHPWFNELATLVSWDNLGRDPRKKLTWDPNVFVEVVNRHFTDLI